MQRSSLAKLRAPHLPHRLAGKAAAASLALLLFLAGPAPAEATQAAPADFPDWASVLEAAQGGTVEFYAWGGDGRINAYIEWAAGILRERHGIRLRHVKLDDTALAVSRVLAEKTAGRDEGGAVGLIWINGENFRAMRENDLLWGPFAERLPSWSLLDVQADPTLILDFSEPTGGWESPWGSSRFNFVYDAARLAPLPDSPAAFLEAAERHPGRLSYPAPPDFYGTSFLKQMLLALSAPEARARFARPAPEGVEERLAATAALWDWLEALHPHLWREGRGFPASGQAQLGLLNDGELWNGVSFSLLETPAKREAGLLPPSARAVMLRQGSLANTHFLAIPYNAAAPAASMAAAEFFLSPEAQLAKQDIAVWGDQTVLSLERLGEAQAEAFAGLPGAEVKTAGIPALSEPHASWAEWIEAEWLERFAH